MNASPAASVSGAEIYALRLDREGEIARDDAQAAISVPVLGGGTRPITVIPWDLAQARHVQASSVFAATVEEELRTRVPMGSPPINRAPMRVLSSVNMPALLLEMGYLTNADQERSAQAAEFQTIVAEALLNAVVRMRAFLEVRP
jgi:N-acetylmuramoyl-L-alanine amidase